MLRSVANDINFRARENSRFVPLLSRSLVGFREEAEEDCTSYRKINFSEVNFYLIFFFNNIYIFIYFLFSKHLKIFTLLVYVDF